MANGFGSLYVGASGLQSSQNGLNVISNNLANIGTEGYVRQRVFYEDRHYTSFQNAAVSTQQTGLGVNIGDVIHARDAFLDRAYRSENGRSAFYAAGYDATSEIETQLQETDGKAFRDAITDLYSAFAEYAKDPSNTTYQNLVIQKSELFLSRASGVYDGLAKYQSTINVKIKNDVTRINELGKEIQELNKAIQRIEAGKVETAMELRDQRDKDLDELSKLADIEYSESADGIVKVRLEGTEFLDEVHVYQLGLKEDNLTGFLTPYWTHLSNPARDQYYPAFSTETIDPAVRNDVGEVKSLLLARGDHNANYFDLENLTSDQYSKGISNSVVMNSQAELDRLVHTIMTGVNDLLAPNTTYGAVTGSTGTVTGKDSMGNVVLIGPDTKILDVDKCCYGESKKLPPEELYTRTGCNRYKQVTVTDAAGNDQLLYVYNEEDSSDLSTCYTLKDVTVNQELKSFPTELPHLTKNDGVAYSMADDIYQLWESSGYTLNPSDITPTSFTGFYTKYIGELATQGSIYKTTSESLTSTTATIESNRQAVIGVSSDEELTNMIKFQNAYNASSRYINVVSEMIEYLLSSVS